MFRQFPVQSLWREMDHLQREMDRIFGGASGDRGIGQSSFPLINIWTNDDGQLVTAEMPGMEIDQIDINITADTLTIEGERKLVEIANQGKVHRNERPYGKFKRSIQLPFMIDTEKVNAKYKNGILKIALVRAEQDKPKKIAISAK